MRTETAGLAILTALMFIGTLLVFAPYASACNTSNISVSNGTSFTLVYGPDGNNGDSTRYVDYPTTTDVERGGTHYFKFKISFSPGCGSNYECMFKTHYKPDGWTVRIKDNTTGVGKAVGTDIDGVVMGSVTTSKEGFSGTVTYFCDVIVTVSDSAPLGTTGNYVQIEVYSEDTACNDEDHIYVKLKFQVVEPHDPPKLTVSSPTPDQEFSQTVDIAWTATDTETPAEDIKIAILYKLRTAEEWTTGASGLENTGSYSWDCSDLEDGDYYLKVKAFDTGYPRKFAQKDIPIIINNPNRPSVEITSPSPEGSEVFKEFMYINWTATDEEEDDSNLLIDLYYRYEGVIEWFLIAEDEPNDGTYLLELSPENFTDRPDYRFKVTAEDSDGMIGECTSTYKHTINNLDGPVILKLYPTGGQTFSGKMVIYWQAEDPDGDDLTITIELSKDAGETWMVLTDEMSNCGTCSYPVQTTDYPDGEQYMIRLSASDGTASGYKMSECFTIFNNDLPTIVITSPKEGTPLSGETQIAWESNDMESANEDMTVNVYYKLGFSSWLFILTDSPDVGYCEWNTLAFEDGMYAIKVEVFDEHGGSCMSEVVEGIELFNPDAPELDVERPIDGQTLTGMIAVQWSVVDPDEGDEVTLSAYYSSDGEVWTKIDEGITGNGYTWDTNTVPDGEYDLKIVASDGMLETEYIIYGLTVKNYINHSPTATIDYPNLLDFLSGVATIRWTAEDENIEDVLTVTLYWSKDLTNYYDIAAAIGNTGSYDWDTTLLDDGEYTLKLTVKDGMGGEISVISERFRIKNNDDIVDPTDDDDDSMDKGGSDKGKSSNTLILAAVIIAGVVLLLLIVMGVLLFLRAKKASDENDPLKQPLPGMNAPALQQGSTTTQLPPPSMYQRPPGLPPTQP
ncbi:MAG: Ser-Thr-rich GPI-anchored membrane family protein [Thermoplasmatota archaeon]